MKIHMQFTIWIDRPPADVFAFISDATNWTSYMPGVVKARQVGAGPAQQGTKFDVSIAFLGTTEALTAEWFRFEQDAVIGSRNSDDSKMGSVSVTTLVEEADGTRLTRVLELEPRSFFVNLAAPLIERAVQRNTNREFRNIKARLEAG